MARLLMLTSSITVITFVLAGFKAAPPAPRLSSRFAALVAEFSR